MFGWKVLEMWGKVGYGLDLSQQRDKSPGPEKKKKKKSLPASREFCLLSSIV